MDNISKSKEVVNNFCQTCVKAKEVSSGGVKFIRCMVLNKPIGLTGVCWAYSNDPNFWSKLEEAISNYKKGVYKIG